MIAKSLCYPLILSLGLLLLPVQAQERLGVIVSTLESRALDTRVEAIGTLQANETAVVTSIISDVISRIHFTDGQRVAAGDLLVELNSREQQAQLEEARIASSDAERQLQRARQLVENRFVSDQELDDRQREAEIARARLRAAEARLADRQIRAPFDSVVGLREVSVGTLLTPGMAITRLHDDSRMKLDFSVPEALLHAMQPGLQIAAGTAAWPGEQFAGEISVVDTRVEQQTRSVRVRAMLDNADGRLRPGMLMSVRIATQPREALMLPEEALLPIGRRQFVMRLQAAETGLVVERVEVHTGMRLPGEVEILGGLQAGDQVVTHGAFRLRPGQPVSILQELKAGDSPADALSRAGRETGE